MSIILTLPTAAEENILVVVDNNTVEFDSPPYRENNRLIVPLRAIAEAAGIKVDYDSSTQTITLTKTEKLIKIPLDSKNPYVDGKKHIVKLTIDSDQAYVDDTEIKLDVSARIVNNRTMVPLRFISESFDMDVIWNPDGIGITYGSTSVLIGTRLRGSAPLSGEIFFKTVEPEIISIVNSNGKVLTLGMDVTELKPILGEPSFAWGRGVPAPQLRYEYGENISSTSDIGKVYAEIGCTLGKVTVIKLGPVSSSKLKTAAGVAVGDPAKNIIAAYAGTDNFLSEINTDGHVILAYTGNTLKYAACISNNSKFECNENDITHMLDFVITNGKITTISIADIISAIDLANN
jgi:Copper amine oxidase N-terminal domain.